MSTPISFPLVTDLLEQARESAERHERHNAELREFIRYLRICRARMASKPFLATWNIQLLQDNLSLEECPLCYDTPSTDNVVQFNCRHSFCIDCCVKYAKTISNKQPVCPMCRTNIETIKTCSNEASKTLVDVHILV